MSEHERQRAPGETTRQLFAERFGLDDRSCRRLLEAGLQRGGDYCDLFFQQRTARSIGLEDHQVNRAYLTEDVGVGVRVIKGEAAGYAFCEELELPSMLEAATIAAAIADGRPTVSAPAALVTTPLPDRYPVERPWSQVSTEERLPLLQRVDERASAADERVRKVRVHLADAVSRVMIVDSEGRLACDLRPMTVASVSCVVQQGARREENHFSYAARRGLEAHTPERLDELADHCVQRALLLLEAVRPAPGEMPVVLAPGSSGILLHEAVGHGMEADFNRKGISIYSDQIGQRIAEPFVSIVDDGTLDHARGALNVDDEGNEGQRTVLVDDGVLATFMHDRISADHYRVAPTGNGRRQSFRQLPLPRMRCTYMLPGPHGREEIIRSVKRGIYAESFTNGQVQIGAGDFTFYIKTGFIIEDGQLTAPVKDVNLIGNGPQVLRDVTMVGDDLELDEGGWTCGKDGQRVPVSLGMPTVKVSSITVGGVE